MIPDFPHDIKIRLARLKIFLLRPDVAVSAQFCWDSQQGRDIATSGCNKIKFQSGQSYSYIMREVWYHQSGIQNYLGFIVSDLIYIPRLVNVVCECPLRVWQICILIVKYVYILFLQKVIKECKYHLDMQNADKKGVLLLPVL